jgi:hypothetical protein
MSKEEKKAEPKASVPAHIANRLVKVKKPKKKDWMAFALKYPPHPFAFETANDDPRND